MADSRVHSKTSQPTGLVVFLVILNMVVTLAIWCFVYEMKHNQEMFTFLFDVDALFSTGDMFLDGMLNGFFFILFIALLSFTLIACIHYKLKNVVIIYVYMSFLIMLHTMPIIVAKDTIDKFSFGLDTVTTNLLIIFISVLYVLTVVMAYFTHKLPVCLRQLLGILNCSFTSVYYLRLLPRHTIWFLLVAVIIWDMFAVESSFGPLKVALQNAHDYNEGLLRFIAVTAKIEDNEEEEEEDQDDQSTDVDQHSDEITDEAAIERENDEEEEVSSGGRTLYEALNQPNLIMLGMGDLIMYSVLVGKSAADGSLMAVLFSMIGIVIGLAITLTLSSNLYGGDGDDESRYLPALPLPIAFGICGHICAMLATKENITRLVIVLSKVEAYIF